jgi:hypothetical protein
VKEFNIYEFMPVVKKIQSGEILINIRSTAIVVRTFVKLLEQINQNLIEICSQEGKLKTESTKKFITTIQNIRLVESQIFAAFVAPTSDVFWQEPDSAVCALLEEILVVVPLKNANKYKQDFDSFMQSFKAIAAAMFKEWEYNQKLNTKINESST